MERIDVYTHLLNLATDVAHAEAKFWRGLQAALNHDDLDINEAARLLARTSITAKKPSRATTYRRIEQWREVLSDLDNPGRGA